MTTGPDSPSVRRERRILPGALALRPKLIMAFAAMALMFGRTMIYFKVWRVHRHMPLLLANFLSALFVWLAENIGTFTKTWLYPHQAQG